MKFSFLIISFLLLSACGEQKNQQSEALKEEMQERELKRVSEGEIMAKAREMGAMIAMESQKTLGGQLKKALQEGGVEGALKYCNVRAYPIMDSMEQQYGASIKRASLRLRNPLDAPTDLERQILEAYEYNIEQGLGLEENLQVLGDTAILYTKPIVLDNALCLNCHGVPDGEVSTENAALIRSLYPEDHAMGHKLGDLRGMWSITLSKKALVKAL